MFLRYGQQGLVICKLIGMASDVIAGGVGACGEP